MEKTKIVTPILLISLLSVLLFTAWFLGTQNGEVRVACVGDSITEEPSYVHILTGFLGRNYSVQNFGSGFSSVSWTSEKPYMSLELFQQAKDFQPNIVVIMLGTNDALTRYQPIIGNFSKDYKQLISEFLALESKPKIFLVIPPPILDDSIGPNGTILEQQIIPQIKQIAAETGLPLIDFHAEMTAHPEYFQDGVHPTAEGSKFIAEKIFQAITEK